MESVFELKLVKSVAHITPNIAPDAPAAKRITSGVDFAMIRVGYRAQKTGVIYADTNAKYNMQQAAANGIKVGAYFFSSSVP